MLKKIFSIANVFLLALIWQQVIFAISPKCQSFINRQSYEKWLNEKDLIGPFPIEVLEGKYPPKAFGDYKKPVCKRFICYKSEKAKFSTPLKFFWSPKEGLCIGVIPPGGE